MAKPSAVVKGEVHGVPYMLASARSRVKPWSVVVLRPWRDVRKGLRHAGPRGQ